MEHFPLFTKILKRQQKTQNWLCLPLCFRLWNGGQWRWCWWQQQPPLATTATAAATHGIWERVSRCNPFTTHLIQPRWHHPTAVIQPPKEESVEPEESGPKSCCPGPAGWGQCPVEETEQHWECLHPYRDHWRWGAVPLQQVLQGLQPEVHFAAPCASPAPGPLCASPVSTVRTGVQANRSSQSPPEEDPQCGDGKQGWEEEGGSRRRLCGAGEPNLWAGLQGSAGGGGRSSPCGPGYHATSPAAT